MNCMVVKDCSRSPLVNVVNFLMTEQHLTKFQGSKELEIVKFEFYEKNMLLVIFNVNLIMLILKNYL